MFCRIQRTNLGDETELEIQLDELDFEYCLPYWFWTKFEWTKYQTKRNKILREIERRDDECSCR